MFGLASAERARGTLDFMALPALEASRMRVRLTGVVRCPIKHGHRSCFRAPQPHPILHLLK
jgi:hypothetical protein